MPLAMATTRTAGFWLSPCSEQCQGRALLDLGILRAGLSEQRDVLVCVLPHCEKVMVGDSAVRLVPFQSVGTGQAKLVKGKQHVRPKVRSEAQRPLKGLHRVRRLPRFQ